VAVADEPRRAAAEARFIELEAELAARDVRIAELEAAQQELKRVVAVLTEKLGQNSANSHRPPSSDGPGAAKGRAAGKKKPSERKRGGQKGHRGARRELLSLDRIDHFVELFAEACDGCGAELPKRLDPDPSRHQVIDWLGGKIVATEIRRHASRCEVCGCVTRAAYDPKIITPSPFGPGLVALVAMLTGVYHLSRRSARQLLRELLGVEISLGALSGLEARASAALAPAAQDAEQHIDAAMVKHADATPWLLAGALRSLWAIATTMATVYKIFSDGARKTVRPLFGRQRGILVSDRASVFLFWEMAMRQICWAHLFRRFVAFSERDGPGGSFGQQLLEYATLVFHYWHAFRDGQLTREELAASMRPVRRQFEACLQRVADADIPRMSGSCADILVHKGALWTFVIHEGVEPTNNHAEQQIRPAVLWRKRSFGSQSERGERFVERFMTVAQTARKQGKNVLDFIVESVFAQAEGRSAPSLLASP
jgi:transposase